MSQNHHLILEYNTRKLIRHIVSNYNIDNYNKIYGLCCLTWNNIKAKKDGYNLIFNKSYKNIDEIINNCSDNKLLKLLNNETGFVCFYKAYRNTAYIWMKNNYNNIKNIFKKVMNISSDLDILSITIYLDVLPEISRANERKVKMSSESLLTPLFACIDPTSRFPIINKAIPIIDMHKKMGIFNLSLNEKVDELLKLMKENNIKNSLYLDVYNVQLVKNKIIKIEKDKDRAKENREFIDKDDRDIKFILTQRRITVVRRHRKMEKLLRGICIRNKKDLVQGISIKYDALIRNYNNYGKDLLIEIKGSCTSSEIRLALGQILDYGYEINQKNIDLAILLPNKPDDRFITIGKKIKINLLWFEGNKINGSIKF